MFCLSLKKKKLAYFLSPPIRGGKFQGDRSLFLLIQGCVVGKPRQHTGVDKLVNSTISDGLTPLKCKSFSNFLKNNDELETNIDQG